jgi:death-on-curing protein
VPPPLWRPTLEDYIDVAGFLLAATPMAIRSLPRIGSAESAIHAPFASFGGQDAYPELLDQAAVLIARHLDRQTTPDLPDVGRVVGHREIRYRPPGSR